MGCLRVIGIETVIVGIEVAIKASSCYATDSISAGSLLGMPLIAAK